MWENPYCGIDSVSRGTVGLQAPRGTVLSPRPSSELVPLVHVLAEWQPPASEKG
jgi:hypothetical protein